MFETGRLIANRLAHDGSREAALRELVAALQIGPERIEVTLNSNALATGTGGELACSIPLPSRKPFREVKVRIDAGDGGGALDTKLVQLVADALAVRQLVINNPGLSINQMARKEGRCRKQLTKLFALR